MATNRVGRACINLERIKVTIGTYVRRDGVNGGHNAITYKRVKNENPSLQVDETHLT